MPERPPSTLACTALEILERMGFLFGEPGESPASAPERVVRGTITFRGEAAGTLELMTADGLARTLAANVLGCEPPEVPPGSELDAVGELMNVMLGHFLTTIAPRAAVFDVCSPCVERVPSARAWGTMQARRGTLQLTVEGEPLLLHLAGARREVAA